MEPSRSSFSMEQGIVPSYPIPTLGTGYILGCIPIATCGMVPYPIVLWDIPSGFETMIRTISKHMWINHDNPIAAHFQVG